MNPALGLVVASLVAVGTGVSWWAGGPPGRPWEWWTPVRVLVAGYLILYGVGAVALAATGEATGGPLLIGGGFVAIGFGAALVRTVAGAPAAVPTNISHGPVRRRTLLLLVGVGLAMYAWLAIDHGIPLISTNAQATRIGWAGIRLDVFRWLVPPAALLWLGVALVTRRRESAIAAAVAIGGVVVLEVAIASRALPLELGLAALLIGLWAGRRAGLQGWILIAGTVVVLFLGVLFARVAPEGGFSSPLDSAVFALNRTIDRVVLIHPRTVEVVVDVYPAESGFLAGATYLRWLDYLRGVEPPQALGSELFQRLFPGSPPGGFAAPGLFAEAYANFGVGLAVLGMVALGAVAAWVGRWLPLASPDVATRALAALVTVALLRTYATSLNGFLLTVAAAIGWWLLVRRGPLEKLGAALATRGYRH